MPMRTHGSDGAGPSQGGEDIPNPPPAPPSLADAIAVLLSATTDNARLLRELAPILPQTSEYKIIQREKLVTWISPKQGHQFLPRLMRL